jgi:hypothetical protein
MLPYVNQVTDLGILLSQSTKTSEQCEKVAKKALRVGSHIFRCFQTRSQKFLKDMFRVYVRPVVEYNAEIFSPYLLKDIRFLERALRSFTKRFPGLRNFSYERRLQILNMQSLEESRLRTELALTFKILKGHVDIEHSDFFEFSTVSRTRGHSMKLKIPRCRLDPVKNFFTNRIPVVWNALPNDVVSAPSVAAFKSRLAKVSLRRFLKVFVAE